MNNKPIYPIRKVICLSEKPTLQTQTFWLPYQSSVETLTLALLEARGPLSPSSNRI
jgi:hypothetical protein